jgi:hypothetical protein
VFDGATGAKYGGEYRPGAPTEIPQAVSAAFLPT